MGSAGRSICILAVALLVVSASLPGAVSMSIVAAGHPEGEAEVRATTDAVQVHQPRISYNWPTSHLVKRGTFQLCGIRLVDAVRGLCKGRIFNGFGHRTSSADGHNRVRRSIIDECCKQPCTVNQMARYCSAERRRK